MVDRALGKPHRVRPRLRRPGGARHRDGCATNVLIRNVKTGGRPSLRRRLFVAIGHDGHRFRGRLDGRGRLSSRTESPQRPTSGVFAAGDVRIRHRQAVTAAGSGRWRRSTQALAAASTGGPGCARRRATGSAFEDVPYHLSQLPAQVVDHDRRGSRTDRRLRALRLRLPFERSTTTIPRRAPDSSSATRTDGSSLPARASSS
jgi:hypothetical protein